MPRKKVFWFMLLSLLVLALSSTMAISQDKGQVPAAGPQKTIEGKILFLKSFGGYVVISRTPHEEYKIINENKEILADLARKGNPVKIDGRLPRGAYFLFIEKIDGQPYSGGK